MKELKEKANSGVFIFNNPEDFLEAIENLQKCYLASVKEGVEKHE